MSSKRSCALNTCASGILKDDGGIGAISVGRRPRGGVEKADKWLWGGGETANRRPRGDVGSEEKALRCRAGYLDPTAERLS